jgi:hypothetical protein
MEQSLINLKRDLLHHLNDYPFSDAWLSQLRDYCDARLKARQEAKATGRVMYPSHEFKWEMIDVPSDERG